MSARDRRLTAALIVGAVVMGVAAPATDAPFYNLLVGIAYGLPAFIAVWGVLEAIAWMHEPPEPSPPAKSQGSNVFIIHRHAEQETSRYITADERRPE